MFLESFHGLLRMLVVGPLAYLALIVTLRVSGKRTLTKMNAFDFVITVALGSTLATVLLSKSVALLKGILAFVILATLQFLIAWAMPRSNHIKSVVQSAPRALLTEGIVDTDALSEERVTVDELKSAARKSGYGDLSMIAAIFLETDGSFTVITMEKAGSKNAFPG